MDNYRSIAEKILYCKKKIKLKETLWYKVYILIIKILSLLLSNALLCISSFFFFSVLNKNCSWGKNSSFNFFFKLGFHCIIYLNCISSLLSLLFIMIVDFYCCKDQAELHVWCWCIHNFNCEVCISLHIWLWYLYTGSQCSLRFVLLLL